MADKKMKEDIVYFSEHFEDYFLKVFRETTLKVLMDKGVITENELVEKLAETAKELYPNLYGKRLR